MNNRRRQARRRFFWGRVCNKYCRTCIDWPAESPLKQRKSSYWSANNFFLRSVCVKEKKVVNLQPVLRRKPQTF